MLIGFLLGIVTVIALVWVSVAAAYRYQRVGEVRLHRR
jgi:hypothetical protein